MHKTGDHVEWRATRDEPPLCHLGRTPVSWRQIASMTSQNRILDSSRTRPPVLMHSGTRRTHSSPPVQVRSSSWGVCLNARLVPDVASPELLVTRRASADAEVTINDGYLQRTSHVLIEFDMGFRSLQQQPNLVSIASVVGLFNPRFQRISFELLHHSDAIHLCAAVRKSDEGIVITGLSSLRDETFLTKTLKMPDGTNSATFEPTHHQGKWCRW